MIVVWGIITLSPDLPTMLWMKIKCKESSDDS